MARKMKKFSEGGAQGRYARRMADIEKDFKKNSAGKSGKALEVLEAKRAQRTADAEDDRAKRMGADRTATRAAERLAESNLTKTRKYGAPKAVTAEAPASKVTDTLGPMTLPKMDSSIGAKPTQKPVQKSVQKPKPSVADTARGKFFQDSLAKADFKKTAKMAEAPTASSKFDSKAFADLKAKAGAGKTPPATGGTLLRGRPGGTPLVRFGRDVANDPARKAKLADMKRAAEAPGASAWAKDRYKDAVSSGMYAKGGKVKKEKTMKYAKGGSTPPQPSAADRARSKKHLAELKKLKPSAEEGKVVGSANRSEGPGYKKGGKMATKFGAAMKKKSADTKGRAMVKKAGGGKCYAKGGSIDGIAKKGKTKGKMV
jgi:hypothetical protein